MTRFRCKSYGKSKICRQRQWREWQEPRVETVVNRIRSDLCWMVVKIGNHQNPLNIMILLKCFPLGFRIIVNVSRTPFCQYKTTTHTFTEVETCVAVLYRIYCVVLPGVARGYLFDRRSRTFSRVFALFIQPYPRLYYIIRIWRAP